MKLKTKNLKLKTSGGQAVILAVIFFVTISAIMGFGIMNPVLRQAKQASDFINTRASLYVSQSVNEDAIYRYKTNKKFVSPSTLTLNGFKATATSTSVIGGLELTSSGNAVGLVRNIKTHLASGSGTSFYYGLQAGGGGIFLQNSSLVKGNVYSNGPVTGENGNLIKGTVVSAGPLGLISGIHATSTAYAHTISSSDIDGDAYYQSISSTSVDGTLHPGSIDQATTSFPISEELIDAWEASASSGGTYYGPCPYRVVGPETMGPRKILCSLYVESKDELTLRGHVWVVGDIYLNNGSIVKTDPSLAGKSVALIAHDTEDLDDHSKIFLGNGAQVTSGSPNSYVLLLSRNNAAEIGRGDIAIEASSNATQDVILYAPHGKVGISNHLSVKEASAYRITAQNNSTISYESGLAHLLFVGGPSGGYVFDGWREVQ